MSQLMARGENGSVACALPRRCESLEHVVVKCWFSFRRFVAGV